MCAMLTWRAVATHGGSTRRPPGQPESLPMSGVRVRAQEHVRQRARRADRHAERGAAAAVAARASAPAAAARPAALAGHLEVVRLTGKLTPHP